MPNRIQHKRNSTPGATPATGALAAGELAVNTADGIIYLKQDNGTVVASGAARSHTHAASDIVSGVISTDRLASSGVASSTTFLRGDGQWATPAGGGGSVDTNTIFHPFLLGGM